MTRPSNSDEQGSGDSAASDMQLAEAKSPDTATGNALKTLQASISSVGKGQNSSTSNKTYAQLIQEAIEALKDRTGSSIPAIKKWLLQEYSHLEDTKHFRQRINQGIKTGLSQGRFEKVRSSYKMSASWKAEERNKMRKSKQAKAAAKVKANAQKSNSAKKAIVEKEQPTPKNYKDLVKDNKEKLRKLETRVTAAELQKAKAQMQKKEQVLFQKEEAERKEKERHERIKKRRFPMEDTKLHEEDRELGVKAPPDVLPRPSLPYFWQMTLPLDDPGRQGRTPDQVLRHSKCDALGQGSRGLVSDLLQVYHFFRGDVHFTGDTAVMEQSGSAKRKKVGNSNEEPASSLVPDFSLSNLIYATEEIINGNARRLRLVPPLISHLFVTSLQLLCRAPDGVSSESTSPGKDSLKHLQFELNKYLLPALTPGSWPDVCHLYMDAIERFYSTDSSRDPSVLPPLNTDLKYLFGSIDEPTIPMTPAPAKRDIHKDSYDKGTYPLPEGYGAYLGDCRSVLFRAHEKLGRSEAWSLTAEEMFALLRALTDDLLGFYPGIADKIALREEQMHELLKAKKAADSKFRKVKFAFEGPKKPKKVLDTTNGDLKEEKDANEDGGNEGSNALKPTTTKKEFESAARAQQKANDAYEKGIRRLVARTEPIGYDRNHNAVYCFRHDPEVLYVEEMRPPLNPSDNPVPEDFQFHRRSWYVIETTSLFDAFTSSLDIRGKREQDLYEAMLGPAGGQQSLRRYLHDDLKVKAEKTSRRREKESLFKKLEAAKVKCDEEKGRRSGRLADQAEDELARIQKEYEEFDQNSQAAVKAVSRDDLTGLALLRSFDSGQDRRETRRSREKKGSDSRPVPNLSCSSLVPSGNIDGTGILGMLVSQLLLVEEACQSVSPWIPEEKRKSWIKKVESAVHSWHILINQQNFAQGEHAVDAEAGSQNGSFGVGFSSAKKRRGADTSNTTVSGLQSFGSLANSLKQPLLEIEDRVAEITYVAVTSRDAEIADDNMSTDGSGDAEKHQFDLAWKRELHRLRSTPARQHVKVRERLVNAISLARKANAAEAVAGLRAALLLFHPNAASDSRKAGISVLEAHGDFSGPELDDDGGDDEGNDEKIEQEEVMSVLSAEAALLTGCLGRSDEATRADWIELVKSCKTLSRLSSLTAGFGYVAEGKLVKIKEERDDLLNAISTWQKDASKNRAGKKKSHSSTGNSGPSEVWADVTFTNEICMAKAEEWPWWPAKVCHAKDEGLGKTISGLDRVLVAFMGEMGGLRIVKKSMIRPFTGEPIADDNAVEVPKKTRLQLDDCLAMARRIQRGYARRGSS
ncbi:hypothetical protein ACA910_011311 [Epithemia clementina (nom. ined.)]